VANFIDSRFPQKQEQWNLDYEKRQLKVDYKPPGTYQSTYGVMF
jgi:hypothetical protein